MLGMLARDPLIDHPSAAFTSRTCFAGETTGHRWPLNSGQDVHAIREFMRTIRWLFLVLFASMQDHWPRIAHDPGFSMLCDRHFQPSSAI
jgi:hypothetical protein